MNLLHFSHSTHKKDFSRFCLIELCTHVSGMKVSFRLLSWLFVLCYWCEKISFASGLCLNVSWGFVIVFAESTTNIQGNLYKSVTKVISRETSALVLAVSAIDLDSNSIHFWNSKCFVSSLLFTSTTKQRKKAVKSAISSETPFATFLFIFYHNSSSFSPVQWKGKFVQVSQSICTGMVHFSWKGRMIVIKSSCMKFVIIKQDFNN